MSITIVRREDLSVAYTQRTSEQYGVVFKEKASSTLPRYYADIIREQGEVRIYASTPLQLYTLVCRQRQSMDFKLDSQFEPFDGYRVLSDMVLSSGRRYVSFAPKG